MSNLLCLSPRVYKSQFKPYHWTGFTVHSLWVDRHSVLPEDVEGTICLSGAHKLMCTWWVIVLLPKKPLEPWRVNPASWSLSLSSLMTWSHTLLISDVSSAGSKWLDLLFFLEPAEDTSEISNMGMRLHVIREDNAVATTLTNSDCLAISVHVWPLLHDLDLCHCRTNWR